MEKQSKTKLIITITNVLFWVVFIGLCIHTGTILYSFLAVLFVNSIAADKLYLELNLTELYKIGLLHYLNIGLVLIIASGLKAFMSYLAIKISMKLNLLQPFNEQISRWIIQISYLAFGIGILQLCAESYYKGLIEKGLLTTNLSSYLGNSGEFLFLAGIIFIIAQVFKRGLEIQKENELTI